MVAAAALGVGAAAAGASEIDAAVVENVAAAVAAGPV